MEQISDNGRYQRTTQRSWEKDPVEHKLNRTSWRIAGALSGLFFSYTTCIGMQHWIGMQHPINPIGFPALLDSIQDYNKLAQLKKENQQYNEIENYTRTAMKIKAWLFVSSSVLPVAAAFLHPSMSDPLLSLKINLISCLNVLSVLGTIGCGVYGLCHWRNGYLTTDETRKIDTYKPVY